MHLHILRENLHGLFGCVKITGSDVKWGLFLERKKRTRICVASFDVTCGTKSPKDNEGEVFVQENILHFVFEFSEYHKHVNFLFAVFAL